jgi:23S rRNA (uracil1939-C5)-methyltransferase
MPELVLDSLAFGGDAVGRLEGKVVFVPFGAPGDTVEIAIQEVRPSYCRARIVTLIEPGPGRREPICDLFGRCGGCHWQQVLYAEQVRAKQTIFQRAMLEARVPEVRPLVDAPAERGYRRRTRMRWRASRDGVTLGYYRRGTRTLLDVARCPLLVDVLRAALDECREPLRLLSPGRGNLSAVADLVDRRVHVSLRVDRGRVDRVSELARALEGSRGVAGGQVILGGEEHRFGAAEINLRSREERPLLGTGATFAQVNVEQDRILRRRLELWAAVDGARVLELYAGVGNLTTGLCQNAAEVVAVEASPASVDLLRRNLGIRVLRRDASRALRELASAGERFDVVVMDPPREGSKTVADLVAEVHPERVVYVSCDPMTLARDLRRMARRGLAPRAAQGLDMMPQTFHIEGLTLLERTRKPGR